MVRRERLHRAADRSSAEDAGVAYSGSTGMLGGVRAMWNIESVKQDSRGESEPAYAYRLVNRKAELFGDDRLSLADEQAWCLD